MFVAHGRNKGGKDASKSTGNAGKDSKKGNRSSKETKGDTSPNRGNDNETKSGASPDSKKTYHPCPICSERGHPAYKCPELEHCREYVAERKSSGESNSVGVHLGKASPSENLTGFVVLPTVAGPWQDITEGDMSVGGLRSTT